MVLNLQLKFIGNICGYDPDYKDYKYMFIWDIEEAAADPLTIFDSAVCVKKCPSRAKYGDFNLECKETDYLRKRNKTCN